MRLSDIKGERCLEVIADLIEPGDQHREGSARRAFLQSRGGSRGEDGGGSRGGEARGVRPRPPSKHKHDVIAILAALEGVDPKEYAEQLDMAKLINGRDGAADRRGPACFFYPSPRRRGDPRRASGTTRGPRRAAPFLRYAAMRRKRETDDLLFRLYLSGERQAGCDGQGYGEEPGDLMRVEEDPRSGEEIAAEVIERCGLEVVDDEPALTSR